MRIQLIMLSIFAIMSQSFSQECGLNADWKKESFKIDSTFNQEFEFTKWGWYLNPNKALDVDLKEHLEVQLQETFWTKIEKADSYSCIANDTLIQISCQSVDSIESCRIAILTFSKEENDESLTKWCGINKSIEDWNNLPFHHSEQQEKIYGDLYWEKLKLFEPALQNQIRQSEKNQIFMYHAENGYSYLVYKIEDCNTSTLWRMKIKKVPNNG